jgi:uncharacterized protein
MKIILAGGTGQVGELLKRHFADDDVRILTRNPKPGTNEIAWDARTLGEWAKELEGADVVIGLAGRSVNCRYTKENLKAMMDSRVESARVIGQAAARAQNPPKLWLQMSTATIYAHNFGPAHDDFTGVIGGGEPGAPSYWDFSVQIAKNWEKELFEAPTPRTRKVALRASIILAPGKGGIYETLLTMVKLGLGGAVGGGEQFVSWIHGDDFARAVKFLIERPQIEGPVIVAAPDPLPQKEFMRTLRKAQGMPVGLPATKWMAGIGAFFLRSDTELLFKSRKVHPARLIKEGFQFKFSKWNEAARDLTGRSRC